MYRCRRWAWWTVESVVSRGEKGGEGAIGEGGVKGLDSAAVRFHVPRLTLCIGVECVDV